VGIQLSTKSPRLISIIVAAIVFGLVSRWACAASGPIADRSIAPIEHGAAGSHATASPPIVLAHLDEQTVPSAENPGSNPSLDATAPEMNPGPSADWDRMGADAASSSNNPPRAANPSAPTSIGVSGAQTGSSTTLAPAVRDGTPDQPGAIPPISTSAAPASAGINTASLTIKRAPGTSPQAPIASGTGASSGSAADASNSGAGGTSSGGEDASAGPPPALDLGTLQSGPDLTAASLDSEIKKADTPARMAALRVTEQARINLAAGKTDDAIRDLGRAVSIDPGNPFEYLYLGRAYIARRNYAQALIFLKRAEIGFASRPDWLGTTVGFEGACYEELGQNSDAARAYQRALGTAPNNLTARVGYTRLAAYLPSPPAAIDAATPPSQDAPPPPEHDSAGPAPAEAAPPPPPAPLSPARAPNHIGDQSID
jgi:hypothetical protein